MRTITIALLALATLCLPAWGQAAYPPYPAGYPYGQNGDANNPNGYDGWPADHPDNPNPGQAGNGGNGHGSGNGGNGGQGPNGSPGGRGGNSGPNGGCGGDGGRGGEGGPIGGDGGDGGQGVDCGGNGGTGGNGDSIGGDGGKGGAATGQNGRGGRGGNGGGATNEGGQAGDGGCGGPTTGNHGEGGRGGDGGPALPPDGGDGGRGGCGGDSTGFGGCGGDAGDGGNGTGEPGDAGAPGNGSGPEPGEDDGPCNGKPGTKGERVNLVIGKAMPIRLVDLQGLDNVAVQNGLTLEQVVRDIDTWKGEPGPSIGIGVRTPNSTNPLQTDGTVRFDLVLAPESLDAERIRVAVEYLVDGASPSVQVGFGADGSIAAAPSLPIVLADGWTRREFTVVRPATGGPLGHRLDLFRYESRDLNVRLLQAADLGARGDVNLDNVVNVQDLNIVAANMFAAGALGVEDGDTDLNGVVDAADLMTVIDDINN